MQEHEIQLGHANQILEKDVRVLSHQVSTLLSRVELIQGYQKHKDSREGLSQLPFDNAQSIHMKLTSFKDIEDLQQQNLKLTRALRELNSHAEEDKSKLKHRITYLETALQQEAQPIIEDLQSIVESKSQMVLNLQAENDVLRKLAEVEPESKLPQLQEVLEARMSGEDLLSSMFVKRTEEQLAEGCIKIKTLQNEITALKEATHEEKTKCEILISELKIKIEALQDNSEKKEKEITQLKSDLNLSVQKQNMFKSECATIKEKHDKLQVSLQHLETELEQASQSHNATLELVHTLKAENAGLVEQEAQLKAQIAGLQKEHDLISTKLSDDAAAHSKLKKTLLANMEQALEERRSYYTQVQELQDCLLSQGARHEQVQQECFEKLRVSAKELAACQEALKVASTSLKEVSTAKAKLEKDIERYDDLLLSSAGNSQLLIKEFNVRLKRAQAEIDELKSNEAQYQSIAQAAESLLQASLQEFKDTEAQLKDNVDQIQSQLEQVQAEHSHEQAEAESQITQLKEGIEKLQHDKESLENQLKISQDHQNKDRATLHAIQTQSAAVEAQLQESTRTCSALKAALAEAQRNFDEKIKETMAQSESLQKMHTTQWAVERNALAKEIECLNQNCLDLKVIIESLSLKTPDPHGLITFLRQEKDRADGRLQSSLINNKRLQAEIDVANAALKNTRKLVGGFNDPSDELRISLNELEEKIQQLNETNDRLKRENTCLAAKIQNLSKDNSEEDIQNLQLDLELKAKEITLLQEANQRYDLQIQKLLSKQNTAESTQDQQPTKKYDETKLPYDTLHKIASSQKYKLSTHKAHIEELRAENQSLKDSLERLGKALNVQETSEEGLISAIQTLRDASLKGPIAIATTPGADSLRARGVLRDRLGVTNTSPSTMSFVRRPVVYDCEDDTISAKRTRPNPGNFPRSPVEFQHEEN
ncbi:hypothetical protein DSO57_1020782 [Entomophthora muscae]|uniref:Uncharacterized protein n=1 Tax=Entomophthora muscae TaxID=34485 RepID=A0ACC2SGI2_9FUNG|nr:hypothetical protein DSO57_1020782 [Entomophthora muscae]